MQKIKGLTEDDRRAVEEAVRQAESRTAAEIVPVVAAASSRYQRAEDVMGIWCAFIAYLILGLLSPERLIDFWEGLIVLGLALALGAFIAHAVPAIKRSLAGRVEMEEQVLRMALLSFRSFGVGETAARTGILIYVSMFERMAVVIGDRALEAQLKPEDYAAIRDGLLEKVRDGHLAEGLAAAIHRAAEILSSRLPRAPGDVDEITNSLRILA